MVTKDVVVKNATGLHARPATLVVKKASQYKSDVNFQLGEKKVNAKSLIAVLSLGAGKGASIKVTASGADEEAALADVAKFIEDLEE